MRHALTGLFIVLLISVATGSMHAQTGYYPSLSFSTVLNGVNVVWRNGDVRLNGIQATFVDDNTKGHTILRTADGKDLYRLDWTAEPVKRPYTRLSINTMTDLATKEPVYGFIPLRKEGDYVLDFYLESGKFYTFPFSLTTVQPASAFSGQVWWAPRGDWDDWGYLMIPGNNPEQSLLWKMWLRRDTQNDKSELHESRVIKVKITGAKGVVCVSRDATRNVRPDWVRWDFDLVLPSEGKKKTTWNQYFKAKDLLAHDGKYTLTVTMDGKIYGKYPFEVKGHKLQYKGRSDRATADHLRFVEGGLDAWWYKREK